MLIHDELWPFFKVYLACILIDWVHKKFTNVEFYEATWWIWPSISDKHFRDCNTCKCEGVLEGNPFSFPQEATFGLQFCPDLDWAHSGLRPPACLSRGIGRTTLLTIPWLVPWCRRCQNPGKAPAPSLYQDCKCAQGWSAAEIHPGFQGSLAVHVGAFQGLRRAHNLGYS